MLSREDFDAWKGDRSTKQILQWFHRQIEDMKDQFASGDIKPENVNAAVQFIQARAEVIAMTYDEYASLMREEDVESLNPTRDEGEND